MVNFFLFKLLLGGNDKYRDANEALVPDNGPSDRRVISSYGKQLFHDVQFTTTFVLYYHLFVLREHKLRELFQLDCRANDNWLSDLCHH